MLCQSGRAPGLKKKCAKGARQGIGWAAARLAAPSKCIVKGIVPPLGAH